MSLQCPISVGEHLEDSPCGGGGGGGNDGTLAGLPLWDMVSPGRDGGGVTTTVAPVITGVTATAAYAPSLEIVGVS